MSALVADASALAEYLLRTDRGHSVESALRQPGVEAAVPALCDVEVASVLRRALLRGKVSPERAAQALVDYMDLPLTRHGHQKLLGRVLQLRDNFSAYDAVYAALAERLGARFLTGDRALARAVRQRLELDVIELTGRG